VGMRYFKELGFKVYDMGGFANNTQDPSLLRVKNFKIQYKGKIVVCNNYFSISYLVLQKMADIFGLLGEG
jgi:hypothetical protein